MTQKTSILDLPGIKLLLGAVIGVFVFYGFLVTYNYYSDVQKQKITDETLQVEILNGDIKKFDETLTMSAKMYAATSDANWEKAYNDIVPKLDTAILGTTKLLPSSKQKALINKIDVANKKLIEIETKAFTLAKGGENKEATEQLESIEYRIQKKNYLSALVNVQQSIKIDLDEQISTASINELFANAIGAIALLIIGFFFWKSIGGIRDFMTENFDKQKAIMQESEIAIQAIADKQLEANEKMFFAQKELQKTQATLKQSETLFRGVVENAPLVIFSLDKQGTFMLSEGQGLEDIGLKSGQVVGMNAFDLYKDSPGVVADLEAVLNGGIPVESISQSSGEYFENRFTPLKDQFGNVTGMVGISANVTDRQKFQEQLQAAEEDTRKSLILQQASNEKLIAAQDKIQESEDGMRKSLEKSLEATERAFMLQKEVEKASKKMKEAFVIAKSGAWEFEMNLDGTNGVLILTDEYYTLFGTTADKEGGYRMKFEDWVGKFVYPDDIHILTESSVGALQNSEFKYLSEHRALKADKTIFEYSTEVQTKLYPTEGVIRGQGIASDVTERKAAEKAIKDNEKRLNQFMEAIPIGLYVIDNVGKPVFANKAAKKMLGNGIFTTDAEELGEVYDVYLEGTKDKYPVADFPIVKALGGIESNIDNMELDMKGTKISVQAIGTPIKDDNGVVQFAIAAFQDITIAKNIKLEEDKRQKRLARQSEALSELSVVNFSEISLSKSYEVITRLTTVGLDVERTSVWDYKADKIISRKLFQKTENAFSAGTELFAKDFPKYFAELETELIIAADDAHTDKATAEFSEVYLKPLGIGAMLDIPIRMEGKMVGVLCNEHIGDARMWESDEISFAKSVADVIALAFEASKRQTAQKDLEEYSKELKQMFGIVQENEVKLDSALRLAKISEFEFDLQAMIMNWSDSFWETVLEAPKQENIGFEEFNKRFTYPEDIEKLNQQLGIVMQSTDPNFSNKFELRIIDSKTSIKTIEVTAKAPVRNAERAPISLNGTIQDITERKAAEIIIEESNQKMKQAFRIAKSGAWQLEANLDGSDAFMTLSDEYFAIMNTNLEEQGKYEFPFEEWMSKFIVPEDYKIIMNCFGGILQNIEYTTSLEVRLKHPTLGFIVTNTVINTIHDTTTGRVKGQGTAQDITERKKAEEEVNRLSLVASKTDNAVIISNGEGLIEWVNDAFTTITGYTLAEVVGKKPGSFLQGEKTDPAQVQLFRENLLTKKPFYQELYNYSKSDNGYWLGISITPILNVNGDVVQFIAIESDITERKASEEIIEKANKELVANEARLKDALSAIEANEKRFANIAANTPDLIYQFFVSSEGRASFPYTSPAIEAIFELKPEDVKDDAMPLISLVASEDRTRFQETVAISAEKMETFIYEGRFITKSGKTKWIRAQAKPELQENGIMYNGTIVDITELKNAEQEVNNALDMQKIINESMIIAQRELAKKNDQLGKSEEEMRQIMERQLEANEQLMMAEKKIKKALDSELAGKEELERTYGTLKDAQSQLVHSEKMASLGQLTAGIAHEINNPINFVYNGIDTLKMSLDELLEIVEKYAELDKAEDKEKVLREVQALKRQLSYGDLLGDINSLVGDIKKGAVRTMEIVKGLRVFSRLDEEEKKFANIGECLDATLTLLQNKFKGRVEVKKYYDETMKEINCYPGQLNQVFMNIINNAIQAISEDRKDGVVTIYTETQQENVVIRIKDNGVGMSEQVKKRVFEPFFTTKAVGVGTGLGMSITFGIIEKHNGQIFVNSEEGKGTEFVIQIPKNLE